ncbi:hypothetical protein R6Q59_025964 [Mikania micrantha]
MLPPKSSRALIVRTYLQPNRSIDRSVFVCSYIISLRLYIERCCNGWEDQGEKSQLQKQYFEQRKRQQQQQEHNSSGLQNSTDKKVPYSQCHENNRSLDVLSLLNLSKNGLNCTSRIPEGRGNSNSEHTTPNYQTAICTKSIQMETKNLCPYEHVETRETGMYFCTLPNSTLSYFWGFLFFLNYQLIDSHPDASRRDSVTDPIKMTTEHKFSVVDMLGGDEQSSNSRANLAHEKHVAFSVEGLGKVEMETPVHSPQHPTRKFSYGWHSPAKIFMGSHSSRKIYCSLQNKFNELDDMAFGVDVHTNASSLELPPYSEELCRDTRHNTFVHDDCLLHDANDFLKNDEFYDSRVTHDAFKQDEKSSFLDHNFVDDNCGLSWKNRSCDLDSIMMNHNHMRSRNHEKPDFLFEGIHMQKRSFLTYSKKSLPVLLSFCLPGLSSSYKHQMEHNYDFRSCYPTRSRNSDFSKTANYSAWPSFTVQDRRDCLSFVSFLLTQTFFNVAWHEETNGPTFKFTERENLRTHEADIKSPMNNFSNKRNTFAQESWEKESGICSRMHNKMQDFSTPGDDWLFEEQCNIENKKPCYTSINTSETQMASPFKPFDSDFKLKFYADEKPSGHDAFSGNLFSDESVNVKRGQQESFDSFFKEEKVSSKMQFQESVSTGETKSVTLPAISSTLQQRNYSTSENGGPVNTLDSGNNHSRSEESNVKSAQMTPIPNAALSPLRSEGGSSSVEMPQKVEEYDGLKEYVISYHSFLNIVNQQP